MALQPYQMSFNGLTFGAGTDIQLVSADGLRDLPTIRNTDMARPRAHGSFAGLSYMDERTITLQLMVMVTVSQDWEVVLSQLAAAFRPIADPASLLPLQVQLPGWSQPLQLNCRPTKYAVPVTVAYSYHKALVHVELIAPDPRWTAVQNSVTIGLSNPAAGAAWPWVWPVAWGSSSGGTFTAYNDGNTSAPAVLTIQGPCTNPWVTIGGSKLTFGITLGSSDTLTVDTDAHTVVLNGTASRYNVLAIGSQWANLPAGSSTVGFGSSDATAVAGTLTVDYASTYASI